MARRWLLVGCFPKPWPLPGTERRADTAPVALRRSAATTTSSPRRTTFRASGTPPRRGIGSHRAVPENGFRIHPMQGHTGRQPTSASGRRRSRHRIRSNGVSGRAMCLYCGLSMTESAATMSDTVPTAGKRRLWIPTSSGWRSRADCAGAQHPAPRSRNDNANPGTESVALRGRKGSIRQHSWS